MAENIDLKRAVKAMEDALKATLQEREQIKKRSQEIDCQLSGLAQGISGIALYEQAQEEPDTDVLDLATKALSLMMENADGMNASLTEACRTIFRANAGWMSALQVRKALESAGFDFSGYTSNPLSSIHTTLKRLKEKGELGDEVRDDTTFYIWIQKDANVSAPAAIAKAGASDKLTASGTVSSPRSQRSVEELIYKSAKNYIKNPNKE